MLPCSFAALARLGDADEPFRAIDYDRDAYTLHTRVDRAEVAVQFAVFIVEALGGALDVARVVDAVSVAVVTFEFAVVGSLIRPQVCVRRPTGSASRSSGGSAIFAVVASSICSRERARSRSRLFPGGPRWRFSSTGRPVL